MSAVEYAAPNSIVVGIGVSTTPCQTPDMSTAGALGAEGDSPPHAASIETNNMDSAIRTFSTAIPYEGMGRAGRFPFTGARRRAVALTVASGLNQLCPW